MIDSLKIQETQRNTTPGEGGRLASLSEVHSSIVVPEGAGFWKKLMAFTGPGLMVAVGYIDPGNWATDIEGGSRFGYTLLSVILISNLFAMLLQHLSLKLGIASGRDLAQACRDYYSRPVSFVLWVLSEIAIAATDLAEVIGSAIALNLLFGLPLPLGVLFTAFDVLIVLYFQQKGFRIIESIVAGLMGIILLSFIYEMVVSQPSMAGIMDGLIPKTQIVTDSGMLYIAIGILGATVMPHNLYLHSSIVQTRAFNRDDEGKKSAIRFATIDSTVSLFLAFFINASILILAATAFHSNGHFEIADITDAYHLLDPVLGVGLAGIFFALALLASGQSSTLTGTLAGQIVMEGFLNIRLKPWLRRLITRGIAIVPALIVSYLYGEKGTADLLVFSQVILSLQLSFAVVPLVFFTSNSQIMGRFANSKVLTILAWVITSVIICLNLFLLWKTFT
ncbi:Nramp family divalent metal transporter [Dyadobacter chenwenxiniae]|uniref:Divalent metal cation transporter MntH n=1 Tax=Dyadobacter chenwenxiniae TaxID=2906456 RepID=A0A9X1TDK5_9BACT|nr:Nramp family divalent metal transporter [Dyadobacter chenwenxiniae]MCF0053914.1 Nramp family divalent metal transporter [Dyadobacter chenwenxiniae]MCF0061227.1 Nramp family divalent metal transporter [Dyadobacter chenwenxiniae]UON81050.1 Nramp family divalent metal transporter [Dyadobacter chenwenxiniae]